MRFTFIFLLTALSLGACTRWDATRHTTPAAVDPNAGTSYPLEIQYEMLGTATAEVCLQAPMFVSPEPLVSAAIDEARYKAIESVEGADNLLYVRVMSTVKGHEACAKVTGRAYAVKLLHARPAQFGPAGTK